MSAYVYFVFAEKRSWLGNKWRNISNYYLRPAAGELLQDDCTLGPWEMSELSGGLVARSGGPLIRHVRPTLLGLPARVIYLGSSWWCRSFVSLSLQAGGFYMLMQPGKRVVGTARWRRRFGMRSCESRHSSYSLSGAFLQVTSSSAEMDCDFGSRALSNANSHLMVARRGLGWKVMNGPLTMSLCRLICISSMLFMLAQVSEPFFVQVKKFRCFVSKHWFKLFGRLKLATNECNHGVILTHDRLHSALEQNGLKWFSCFRTRRIPTFLWALVVFFRFAKNAPRKWEILVEPRVIPRASLSDDVK